MIPLRILWPISCDGRIVVVQRGDDWPQIRRLSVWRWAWACAAWRAREDRRLLERELARRTRAAAWLARSSVRRRP